MKTCTRHIPANWAITYHGGVEDRFVFQEEEGHGV